MLSLLAHATLFPHAPKTRCWASSAELPAADTRRPGGHLLPNQPMSFPGHVCPQTSLPGADLMQVSPDTRSWRGSHPPQPCAGVPRDAIAGVRSRPPCPQPLLKAPPGFIAQAITSPAASEMHKLILRSRPRVAAQQRASSRLCLPVPPPAPRRGTLTG